MSRRLRVRLGAGLAGLLVACAAAALAPDDFARQWTVLGDCSGAAANAPADAALACEGAFVVALDESVYRQVVQRDLADLAAFNAEGDVLAFGPMPQAWVAPPPEWVVRPWFALPAAPAGPPEELHLHVQRDTAGNLSLDATLRHAGERAVRDLLVDVRAGRRAVEAIEFELALGAPDFSAMLAVEASEDLQHWRTVVPATTVAQLRQDGQALVQRRIEFAPVQARYLRLHAAPGGGVPLRSLRLRLHADGPRAEAFARETLRATLERRDGRAYVFRAPARVPVEALDIELASGNAVASFAVSARDAGARDWRYVGQLDAFRLRGAGLRLDNEPLEFAPLRAHEWRIEPNTELADPPVLSLSWRPEPWLLLTHGTGPYRVVAGSAAARRQAFPLELMIGEVRRRYGAGWQPPAASLGPMRDAGGNAALSAWDPARKRAWLLWGVLGLASLAIIAMVLRLLRQPDP